MPTPWKRFKRRWMAVRPFQRHSLVQLVAGLVYMGIGLSTILSEPNNSREVALQFAYAWMPAHSWGAVFFLSGLLSVLSARWPPQSKIWGYMVLTGLSAGWSAFYLVGILFGSSPKINYTYVLTWGLIAFLWWAISGLMNPEDVVHHAEFVNGSA